MPQLSQNCSPEVEVCPQLGQVRSGALAGRISAGSSGSDDADIGGGADETGVGGGGGTLATGASWTPQLAQNISPGTFT